MIIYSICRKIKSVSCAGEFYFFCSTPMIPESICPKDFFNYKGDCIYKGTDSVEMTEAMNICAMKGSIVLPIKSEGMFKIAKKYSRSMNSLDLYIGMNLTSQLYTDNTDYTDKDYDFNGESSKFKKGDCVYLKKGIGYAPRSTKCDKKFQFFCLWKGK